MSKISLEKDLEKDLIKKSRQDKSHFTPIYRHYYPHIHKFFNYRLQDHSLSDELTSITFEKALIGLDNFQWQGIPFSSWLYRIARNTLTDYYRKSGKRQKTISLEENTQPATTNVTPLDEVETMFAEDFLKKVLNELPEREREIIYLKFYDGYTNKLIAELTGLSETNVGTIIYRSIRKLRKLYLEME